MTRKCHGSQSLSGKAFNSSKDFQSPMSLLLAVSAALLTWSLQAGGFLTAVLQAKWCTTAPASGAVKGLDPLRVSFENHVLGEINARHGAGSACWRFLADWPVAVANFASTPAETH
jgi:hypothetical protein